MFRLFLALSCIFILGTFVVSKNQSVSGNFLSINTRTYRLFVDEYMFLNIHAQPGKFIA